MTMEIEDIKRLQSTTPNKLKPPTKPKPSRWSITLKRMFNRLFKHKS